MNFELIKSQWFDADALRVPDYQVGRVSYGYGRSYIKLKDGALESPFRIYTSLTTAISQCSPMEQPLLEWYCKHGYEGAKRLTKDAQMYGTLMHIEIGKFLTDNYYTFTDVPEVITAYLTEHNYTPLDNWKYKLKYDMAAFIAFAHEVNLKPLGIEYVLVSDRGFGTLIDLVCIMDIEEKGHFGEVYKSGERKGEPKSTSRIDRKTCIINFKSGRNGVYRSNGIQVECERQLFEENFPDVKIEHAFNWAPKEWETSPSWTLKDWTGEIEQAEIDSILELARVRFGDKAIKKRYVDISGTAYSQRGIEECITVSSVEEYCKQVYSQYL